MQNQTRTLPTNPNATNKTLEQMRSFNLNFGTTKRTNTYLSFFLLSAGVIGLISGIVPKDTLTALFWYLMIILSDGPTLTMSVTLTGQELAQAVQAMFATVDSGQVVLVTQKTLNAIRDHAGVFIAGAGAHQSTNATLLVCAAPTTVAEAAGELVSVPAEFIQHLVANRVAFPQGGRIYVISEQLLNNISSLSDELLLDTPGLGANVAVSGLAGAALTVGLASATQSATFTNILMNMVEHLFALAEANLPAAMARTTQFLLRELSQTAESVALLETATTAAQVTAVVAITTAAVVISASDQSSAIAEAVSNTANAAGGSSNLYTVVGVILVILCGYGL